MDDFGISGSSITSGFGYGSSGSGLKFSGGMPTSKTYISGIPPRTVKTETNYRSTIRDTGRGQATTSAFVPKKPDQDNTFDKIKAQCIASGRKWEDPDFPATASSLYFRNPPSAWPNIQWKRPHVSNVQSLYYVTSSSSAFNVRGPHITQAWDVRHPRWHGSDGCPQQHSVVSCTNSTTFNGSGYTRLCQGSSMNSWPDMGILVHVPLVEGTFTAGWPSCANPPSGTGCF